MSFKFFCASQKNLSKTATFHHGSKCYGMFMQYNESLNIVLQLDNNDAVKLYKSTNLHHKSCMTLFYFDSAFT